MKRNIIITAALILGLPMAAQETYENANIATKDLNGTARYVGMGGAMDALGADLSTISSNPAGMGLFRHSQANISFGIISQQDAKDFANGNKTNASFDQAGFVYTNRTGRNSFLNLSFNYHKSRNFDYILSASDKLSNASQNKLSYQKLRNGMTYKQKSDGSFDLKTPYISCNVLDALYTENLLFAAGDGKAYYYAAEDYTLNRAQKGYIGEYDFNISGNIRDRVYLGLTIGLHDVNYKHYGEYHENLISNAEGIKGLLTEDNREITGTGVNIKAGVIFRPIETSPFRIGLAISTPTWYSLSTSNYTIMTDGFAKPKISESYDFKLNTPWTVGMSLGHTVGNYLALGAAYEYAGYNKLDSRINDSETYDYWTDSYYTNSHSDERMNRHTENTLKGVSTLKLGMEYKATKDLALRLGYNYVSPMYRNDGFKDGTIESPGTYYGSTTDYTNWKSTNRITCGIGYRLGKVSMDLAYQYSTTEGETTPFMSYTDHDNPMEDNIANAVKTDNKRHQILFTLGYQF